MESKIANSDILITCAHKNARESCIRNAGANSDKFIALHLVCCFCILQAWHKLTEAILTLRTTRNTRNMYVGSADIALR